MKHEHPEHKAHLSKLNRVSGQIDGIKKMIGDHRYCADIIIQIRAARAALRTVEAGILETHLQHCIADAINNNDKKETQARIDELKGLLKRFDD